MFYLGNARWMLCFFPLLSILASTLLAEDYQELAMGEDAGATDLQAMLLEEEYEHYGLGRKSGTNLNQVTPMQVAQESVNPKSHTLRGMRREQARERMLEDVDSAWIRDEEKGVGGSIVASEKVGSLRDKLSLIKIPDIAFRDIPLSQVCEQLTQLSGDWAKDGAPINFVLLNPEGRDPEVSLLLKHLNLRRILDFIVESVGFEYEVHADAIIVRQARGLGFGLETAFYPVSRSTLIRLTGIPEEIEVSDNQLNDPFAEDKDNQRPRIERTLRNFLQRAGVHFDGVEGADLALADGQLIVTQTARNHERLQRLLRKYRQVKQVEIEARFIEVQERNLEELGFEWRLAGGGKPLLDESGNPVLTSSGKEVFEGRDRFGNSPSRNLANAFTVGGEAGGVVIDRPGFVMPDLGSAAPILPATIDLAEAAGSLADITGYFQGMDIGILIRALERQSGNDLLSAPKVTVLSGKTAEIVVAEEFRYPEFYGDTQAEVGGGDSSEGSAGVAITAGTPRDFATRNIGVEMEVTPTVEEDNSISLRLYPKVTEFEGFVEYGGTSVAIASDTTVTVPSGFYQPVFSIRKLRTEVTIWDGATVVMGGLTREHSVRIHDKVPILGSIPVLGRLFRTEGESTQKRNLLIFVTANLVSPGGSPAFQKINEN